MRGGYRSESGSAVGERVGVIRIGCTNVFNLSSQRNVPTEYENTGKGTWRRETQKERDSAALA